jgi:ABC-2 type transport system ATP-binding protein
VIEADRGSIHVGGIDARASPALAKSIIGTSLQATSLPPRITPAEALWLFGAMYPDRVDTGALLERFGLAGKANSAFDTLSGGQQQRLALALAVVHRPRVVLLDEPTAGLDPAFRRDVHDDIEGMKRDGCAILLATHDMTEAERLCDRIYLVDHGRIAAEGKPLDLISAAGGEAHVAIDLSLPLAPPSLAALSWAHEIAIDGTGMRFPARDLNARLSALIPLLDQAHIAIMGISVERLTLEDIVVAHARRDAMP